MPVSDDTILRQLKRRVAARCGAVTVRVAGIDDWSWRRGCGYGTMVVDLERRVVVDVLADRSAAGTADWLRAHPEVEIISRDRSGLYAQGGREGAPQARQIADRFHLFQNLRELIEAQLSRVDRPTGCRGALHQAARITDARSGREDRRVKKRLAGVHDHARSRNAVSRHFSRKRHRQTRRVAGRRAAIRHLRDAALCAHVAKRYRRCEECCDRLLEQRPDRRADQ